VLADLSEGPHFDFFQPGHNFSHELGDEKFAGSGVTKMGPDRFLAKFLNHDRYESIKHARVSEKLFNVDLSLAVKRVNVVQQINAEILLDRQVLLFVLDKIIFYFFAGKSGNFVKFDFPLARECKSVELVSDAQAFFACHDTIGLVARIVILFNSAERLSREHSFKLFVREHSVAANVRIIMVCQTLALRILDDSTKAVEPHLVWWFAVVRS
jgi:hypothetical protein